MPPRTRSKKQLQMPKIVLESKAFLEQNKSESLSVMKKLTESEDVELQQALIRMWISLEKSINSNTTKIRIPKDIWPHCFVEHVRNYSNFPPYFYQTKNERKKLVTDIKKQITGLTKALKANNLDHHLAYAESKNTLDFIERMMFLDNWKAEQSTTEKPTVSEILDRLLKTIEAEVPPIRQTKKDGSEEARVFASKLAGYLEDVHGEASNAVISTATKVIMGRSYAHPDIVRIRKRSIGKSGGK